MKELSIEQKAKAYDKALEIAKKVHKYSSDIAEIKRIEEIFPELKESKGERIRKALISVLTSDFEKDTTIDGITVEEIVDWLEKQGQKPYGQREECLDCQFNYAGECKGSCTMKRSEIDKDKAEMDYCFTKMMNGEKVSSDEEEYNGEDYGIDGLYHAQRILEKTLGKVEGYQTDDGILSHKCAITAVKKLYEQKPIKWSEEDEYMLNETIQHLEELIRIDKAKHLGCDVQYYQRDIDWINAIKERIRE